MATKNLEELKSQLVSEIQQRVTDKILEQTNADLLIKLINQAETETEAMNIAALGTTYKRTGFHFDKRLEKISNNIRYKAKNDRLSFVNDENRPTHELIIGDNFDALQNLLITHKGKIDVIYIDPPYGKDNMGEFAKTNYDNSITRDNLLSMLYPRLLMAKRLLTPEGVIFCSIDDKNQAYVKCLFDEVFGEKSYITTIVRKTKSMTGDDGNGLNIQHEYLLVYAKNKDLFEFCGEEKSFDGYSNPDNDPNGDWCSGDPSARSGSDATYFPIENPYTKKCDYPPKGRYWAFSEATKEKYIKEGRIKFKKVYKDNQRGFIFKRYKDKMEKSYDAVNSLFAIDNVYMNQNATTEAMSIFNETAFDYPKPIEFISKLIQYSSKDDSTILDFFAGSGTTGHAVLDLNKQDGGNRKFILCQCNEKTDTNPNGIAYDVTAKRLKRVMSGECYDGTIDFPWLKDHEPYRDNLNVYEIETVSKTEYRTGETAFDKIDETCYGLPKFEKLTDKIEWVCKNFENASKMEGDKSC